MKILQLSKFYPPVNGGIESVAYELTEGLNKFGVTTDVLCSDTGLKTVHEKSKNGYSIIRAGTWGSLLSTSLSPALIALTRQLCINYDIIHLHMPNPMAALALWIARPKGKIVTHWHSDVVHQKVALKFYEPLQTWILKRSDAIIVATPPYLESSAPLQPWLSKIHVFPYGISHLVHKEYLDDVRNIQIKYFNKKIVFSLGRMVAYKGFDTLIEAARYLEDNAIILVGGGGELLRRHQARAQQEGLEGRIQFLGRISDEEISRYFEAASVFCLPSTARSEAFGVVQLEAMASGKPIVATNIPGSGVSWVNQHFITGLNVPICDSKALAKAINTILSNEPLATKMSNAGKERFAAEFTAETMIRRTIALYTSVSSN